MRRCHREVGARMKKFLIALAAVIALSGCNKGPSSQEAIDIAEMAEAEAEKAKSAAKDAQEEAAKAKAAADAAQSELDSAKLEIIGLESRISSLEARIRY